MANIMFLVTCNSYCCSTHVAGGISIIPDQKGLITSCKKQQSTTPSRRSIQILRTACRTRTSRSSINLPATLPINIIYSSSSSFQYCKRVFCNINSTTTQCQYTKGSILDEPAKPTALLLPHTVLLQLITLLANCRGAGAGAADQMGLQIRFFFSSLILVLLIMSTCCVLPLMPCANAVLYSPDTKVPRSSEVALRRAIPANSSMKAMQSSLENISYLLRIPQRKPYATMEGDARKALEIGVNQKDSIIGSIPVDLKEQGLALYDSLITGKGGIQDLIKSVKESDPDKVSVYLASSLNAIGELELLQAPGLSYLLPQEYFNYPRLTGRATVEFTFEKGDGSLYVTSRGESSEKAKVQVVLDGYSAPLTAGNFIKLVSDGAYDGIKIKCANEAIISDNELETSGISMPLEIMPSGEFEPLYKSYLDVQGGELPVLPLSVYGAVAMAHSPNSEEYSSPSQFFIYLYDKRNAGLGGLSFEEGQFSVFGYTTCGREILSQLKTGDLIQSAKVVQGKDRLVLPAAES